MRILLIAFLLCWLQLSAVDVDLKNPTFSEGVLSTESGGVISAPNFRLQALKICYERSKGIEKVSAEEELMVNFGEHIFVGERLEFDFITNEGVLYQGISEMEPWFIGGQEIYLKSDGSYWVYKGFATASENVNPDWQIEAAWSSLNRSRDFSAENAKFRLFNFTLFWVPRFRINLDSIFDSPLQYTVRFGGYERTRIGISYDAFSWAGWKTRLSLDYRFARGFGAGVNIDYESETTPASLHTTNYVARDVTLYNDKKRTRYRYRGEYENYLESSDITILGSYDLLSDKEMATDYGDQGLTLFSGDRTQLEVQKRSKNWLVNFLARVRINDFQTVKEELPTLSGNLRPFGLARTGVITHHRFSLSYLRLHVFDNLKEEERFHGARYELLQHFYRPFHWKGLALTPDAGFLAIYYGNNAKGLERWLTMGLFQLNAQADFHKHYGSCKHLLTPYACYRYYTYPESSPEQHFIFDLNDGWYKLNELRVGMRNTLFEKKAVSIAEKFYSDLYFYSFFDTKTLKYAVPKAYAQFVSHPSSLMTQTVSFAWDFEHGMLDHWKSGLAWTIDEKNALRIEYRHRSAFCWRKVDADNFMLDSFRSPDELRHTDVSDRRDTFLLSLYHRFHPNWGVQVESRHGWNRRRYQPDYNEFQIDLLGTFRSSLHIKISYRHKEEEKDRITINLSMGLDKPDFNG